MPASQATPTGSDAKPEPKILFQHFFKSVGPRTYVAQVKEAANGNHFVLLTEGKRDDKTGEVRKTKLIVFSEDFVEFFRMLDATVKHIRVNPVPPEIKRKREQYWARQAREADASAPDTPAPEARPGAAARSAAPDRRSAARRAAPAMRK